MAHEVTAPDLMARGFDLSIRFDDAAAVAPVLDTTAGSFYGCKVWNETAAQATAAGLDEGVLTIVAGDGTPAIPTCRYVAGVGYRCIAATGMGGNITPDFSGQRGAFFTDNQLVTSSDMVGQYLSFFGVSGIVTFANCIISVTAQDTILIHNRFIPQQDLPDSATWAIGAGGGLVAPGFFLPDHFSNDDQLTVALTAGGSGHFPSFVEQLASAGVGDSFTLDTASLQRISAIPVDGTAFSLGCDGAGGSCGVAEVSTVLIETTDGGTSTGPFLPPVAQKRVVIRCAAQGADVVTVPPAVSAHLIGAGATRIRTAFLRSAIRSGSASGSRHDILAGHAVAGFTTPPAPDGGT
jgi:hypothetical protein